ncbi:MAG: hypothetical protein NC200_05530 [Candidatus Gastranaerophilales bacterium]|nr:hypothetical protein [Candidatus Gastranaerophilales bacterium]
MNPFDINKIDSSDIDTLKSQVSTGKRLRAENAEKKQSISKSGVTKPTIELDDFFAYLDPKVVEKIMETPEESRTRIVQEIHQYEFDINGAQNILDSLG